MAINTYDDLVREIKNWSNRKDLTDDEIQSFVYFTGSMVSQNLRVVPMENTALLDVSPDGHVVIPYDFLELRSMTASFNSDDSVPLERVAWDQFVNYNNEKGWHDTTPRFYSRQGPYFFITPNPPAGSIVTCHYYRTMPDINKVDQRNWLMDLSPVCYLYGSLHFLFLYIFDEERAAFWEGKFKAELERIQIMNDAAEYKGTTLTIRHRTTQGDNTYGL